MTIIPAGKKVGNSSLGIVYQNSKGPFFLSSRSLLEIIEARATNGKGYISHENIFETPYAEDSFKDKINPEVFCYVRTDLFKFPHWLEDVKEGHPDYGCVYHEVISLD